MTSGQYGRYQRPWLPARGDQGAAVTARRPTRRPPLQLQLGGMGPAPGTTWHNRHTGEVAVVLGVGQRRKCWVMLRCRGREVELALDVFEAHWAPGQGDTLSKRLTG